MRHIDEIVVHCTATRAAWRSGEPLKSQVEEVRKWHVVDRGWSDIGYHFLIGRKGDVAEGRPIERTGAGVKGHNTGRVHVALFGGHGSAETDAFADHFTKKQDKALRKLIGRLETEHTIKRVSGHNEYAAKACPGFSVPEWIAQPQPAPAPVNPQGNAERSPLAPLFAWLANLLGGPKQ